MDILQANQEIQRLRGLFATGQITPEAFAQAVNQLQITDTAGNFWHVDGATLRWYRFEGQTWVERTPPLPAPPPYPVQSGGPSWTAPNTPLRPVGRSSLPLWIGLGGLGLLLVIAAAVIFGRELFASQPTPTFTPAVPPEFTASATQSPGEATATSTQGAANTTQTPSLQTATPTPAENPTPEPTAPSAADFLKPEGPWLLSKDNDNVYWIQSEGSVTLNGEKVISPFGIEEMLSPSGGNVAFITSPAQDGMHQLKLTIYNLPIQNVVTEIALTSPQTEPGPNAGPGDPSFEALRSITDFTSIAWSPDGRQLAFIGFIDGPSSDLYLYTLDTGVVTRLTDGPSQAFEPSWSPDGKYIVQFGADSFGTGAGYSMTGVWATRPDNGTSIELYTPTSSGEIGLGWAGPNTYLVYGFSPACGEYNLRAVDIQPIAVRTIFSGCFNAIDFDPAAGSVLLGIDQGTADFCSCGDKVDSGLYLLRLNGSYQRLDPGNFYQAIWIDHTMVAWGMTDKDQVLAFSQDGNPISLPAGVPGKAPLAAPGGEVLAWTVDTIGPVPALPERRSTVRRCRAAVPAGAAAAGTNRWPPGLGSPLACFFYPLDRKNDGCGQSFTKTRAISGLLAPAYRRRAQWAAGQAGQIAGGICLAPP